MSAISSAAMLFLVTRYGVTTIAAYGVTSKLEILLFYPAMAIGCVFTAVTTILITIFAKELSGLFVDSMQAAEIVKNIFQIISIGYVMYMITSCFLGIISGSGKPEISMLLFFLYYIVIRIPLAMILVHCSLGLNGIWVAIFTSHVLAALIAGILERTIVKENSET